MKNKIIHTSFKEMEKIKNSLNQNNKAYIVEIEGKQCPYLAEYLDLMSNLFQFPIKAKGLDGYNDWLRDLSWINKKEIIIIINDFEEFLWKDASAKKMILEDFKEIILPWWETEVLNYMVGGETKKVLIYLVK